MNPNYIWFETIKEIREAFPEAIENYDDNRSMFVKNAKLSRIIGLLHSSYKNRFIAKEIFSCRGLNPNKTKKILLDWENGIPPRVFFENKYLLIEDGNHRMNAAFCLGAEFKPLELVMPKNEIPDFFRLFGEIEFYR